LFDERDLAESESPDFPGEPLVVCKNPALAVLVLATLVAGSGYSMQSADAFPQRSFL
jgi:hypothetical protein